MSGNVSSQPTPMPSAMFLPIPAISREGLWIPKKSLMLSTTPPKKPAILLLSQAAASEIPLQMPLIRFRPILAIASNPPANPPTMASMICGTAATTPDMIAGRLLTSATKS